jgi:hypothetical protein
MEDLILGYLIKAILLVFGFVGAAMARLIWEKFGTEKATRLLAFMDALQTDWANKDGLAWKAVKFAEQEGIDFNLRGQQKLNTAVEWMIKQADRAGLTITHEEAYGLIKAILREIKDTYGEEWAAALKEAEDSEEDPEDQEQPEE